MLLDIFLNGNKIDFLQVLGSYKCKTETKLKPFSKIKLFTLMNDKIIIVIIHPNVKFHKLHHISSF